MTNLDWAIEEIGEKNKYTMVQVMLLQKRSSYDLTKQEAMNLIYCVAEYFSKPIAKTIEYVDIQPIATEPKQIGFDEFKDCVSTNDPNAFMCLECGEMHELTCEKPATDRKGQQGYVSEALQIIETRKERQKNGTDFIQIHHFEKCPNTGLIIFYVNTRCKKKRTKRFTGSLENYDFQTRSYNNLDRSFSKIYENNQKKCLTN